MTKLGCEQVVQSCPLSLDIISMHVAMGLLLFDQISKRPDRILFHGKLGPVVSASGLFSVNGRCKGRGTRLSYFYDDVFVKGSKRDAEEGPWLVSA